MKNRQIMLTVLCWATTLCAQQNTGVQFLDNPTMKELLARAQEKNKPILIDCYTAWCGPCKKMLKEVFTQKEVGDYLNEHFICAKIDMEKGEGPALGKQYTVKAFPTFLYLTAEGKWLYSSIGGCTAEEFIQRARRTLEGRTFEVLQAQYDEGKRDEAFLLEYADALFEQGKKEESQRIALQLLEGKTTELLTTEGLYHQFRLHVQDPFSPVFQYVATHEQEFMDRYGTVPVKEKLRWVWTTTPARYLKHENGQGHVDEQGLNDFVALMKQFNVEDRRRIELDTRLLAAEYTRQWDRYVEICDTYLKELPVDDAKLYNWAYRTEQYCSQPATRRTIASWLTQRLKEHREEASGNSFHDLYRQLLTKLP